MSEPLKYKAEKAISAFIEAAAASALSGWNHYQGQNPGEQIPPAVVVLSGAMTESFPQSRPKNISITIEVVSSMDTDQDADNIRGAAGDRATNWGAHRSAVAAIEERMHDREALQRFASSANRVNRPVAGFFVYDVQEDGQQSTMSGEERMLVSVLNYTLICEAQDN